MATRPPPRPSSTWRWARRRHRSPGARRGRTDQELSRAFLQELRDALPAALLRALPGVPVTLLFVVFSQAKAGQAGPLLMHVFGLTEHEAAIVIAHARLATGDDQSPG